MNKKQKHRKFRGKTINRRGGQRRHHFNAPTFTTTVMTVDVPLGLMVQIANRPHMGDYVTFERRTPGEPSFFYQAPYPYHYTTEHLRFLGREYFHGYLRLDASAGRRLFDIGSYGDDLEGADVIFELHELVRKYEAGIAHRLAG